MNPEKHDVYDVYLTYARDTFEDVFFYDYKPVDIQIDVLYGESYAILEETSAWDFNSTCHYEVLYVSDEGINLQKFYRKELENTTSVDSHPLFQGAVLQMEEVSCETISIDDIIDTVYTDLYSSKLTTKNEHYRKLLRKSELFYQLFVDLYHEVDNCYREGENNLEKKAFTDYLQTNYRLQLVQSKGTEYILSNCVALMRKLKLSQQQMAEYFIKYLH